jgi:hypothetical protein
MVEVPSNVLRLMWEYDQDILIQGSELPDAIIERVMARGGWSEMRWLLRTVDHERLRTFLTERGSRVLPPRELSFWALACEIPEATAADWRHQARLRESTWRG